MHTLQFGDWLRNRRRTQFWKRSPAQSGISLPVPELPTARSAIPPPPTPSLPPVPPCAPANALTLAPGRIIPARFNGSAVATLNASVDSSDRRSPRNRSIASLRANCSPTRPATNRPPRTSPRASMRRSTTSKSRQAGASVSRASRSRNTTPQRSSNWLANASCELDAAAVPAVRNSAHRPAACRGRALRPFPSPRLRFGSTSERRFSKPSAVTNPAATSSQSPSSTSLDSRPVARVRSGKNDAPCCRNAPSTSRAAMRKRILHSRAILTRRRQQPFGILAQKNRNGRHTRGTHTAGIGPLERRMR